MASYLARRRKVSLRVTNDAYATFHRYASPRHLTAEGIMTALVTVIAKDNLIDAIVDSDDIPTLTRSDP